LARDYFLTTPRLGFSRWSQDDLPLALALWGDPEVSRYVGGPFSHEQIQERLNQEIACMDEHGFQYWPIFVLASDEFAGCCGMRAYKPADQIPAFGFYLRPAFWGQGLATEAGRAAIGYTFESLGARAIFAGRHPKNASSHKALEKLGFRYTHGQLYPPTGLMHPSYLLERPMHAGTASG
jgi:[ribosomal protein S5]-alanine N-acetyltransferase